MKGLSCTPSTLLNFVPIHHNLQLFIYPSILSCHSSNIQFGLLSFILLIVKAN